MTSPTASTPTTLFSRLSQQPWRQRFRKLLGRLHLYLGLAAGLVLIVIGVTGAILVFEQELDRQLHPDLWQVTPQGARRPVQALVDQLRAANLGLAPTALAGDVGRRIVGVATSLLLLATDIGLPAAADDPIAFVRRMPRFTNPNAQSFVFQDGSNGKILRWAGQANAGRETAIGAPEGPTRRA